MRDLRVIIALELTNASSYLFESKKPFNGQSREGLPNFDRREQDVAGKLASLPASKKSAVERLKAEVRDINVELDPITGAPRSIGSPNGFLTGSGGRGEDGIGENRPFDSSLGSGSSRKSLSQRTLKSLWPRCLVVQDLTPMDSASKRFIRLRVAKP